MSGGGTGSDTSSRFRLTPPSIDESDVASSCLKLLRRRGWRPFRQQSGLFRTKDGRTITAGERGLPDYICLHARRPGFLLELKRPGGILSQDQRRKHDELRGEWRLAVAVVDGPEELAVWLAGHERSP